MDFKITKDGFRLNDNDFFIFSGEIHYFRIPKKLWKLHLAKLKEANCNAVSFYIPWCWHEYEDNKFDFTGDSRAERDLIGFLNLCYEMGLYVIVKPGPYILAEYKRNGLPEWLFEKYPEVQALDKDNNIHPLKMTSYMNPVYLKYAKRWYKNVMPIIEKYQISNDKMIIMMQLCNEIAFYYWFSAEGDYNRGCIKHYHDFLKRNYGDIAKLNKVYQTNYEKFSEVKAPSEKVKNKKDYLKYRDWHLFYRWYYAAYLIHLLKEARSFKITIPAFHNLPGWIDGRALEYPVNIIMYDELGNLCPEIMLGVDHIPEAVDFRNMHDDLICNEVVRALQGHRYPVLGIEMQAGSRHHKTRVYANELNLFYKACLAHGMKGMNFYMFSQGVNPPRKGDLGPVFYWQTPLDVKGEQSDLYEVIRNLGKFIKTHGENLINVNKHAEICVGLYRPYYHTEFTIPAFGKRKMDVSDLGLSYDPKRLRDQVLFDGLLRSLQVLNEDFIIEDIQAAALERLKKYKQLWIISLDYMDKDTQKKLADYVKGGGHLIIMPTFPNKDLDLNDCAYLEGECGIKRKEAVFPVTPKIDLLGVKDFQCLSRINLYEEDASEVIARTEKGECCGLTKNAGKGRVTVLGTAFSYELGEHLEAYGKLIATDKIKKYTLIDNPEIIAGQLFNEEYSYLYVLNYHRNAQAVRLTVKSPAGKEEIIIPFEEKLLMPPTYGFITPINLRLSEEAVLKYATSELLSMDVSGGRIKFEVAGHPDLKGGLVLELSEEPKRVLIDGKEGSFRYKDGKLFLSYSHQEKPFQVVVSI